MFGIQNHNIDPLFWIGYKGIGKFPGVLEQTPEDRSYMVIKYLSVDQMIWFIYQQIALDVLFQMRYDSLPNSNKHSTDRLKAEATPVFTSNQDCFAYCFVQWWSSGVCQSPSTFWSFTLQPIGIYQATIWHMKGEIHGFHMRYKSLTSPKRLQKYGSILTLKRARLVYT